MKNKIILIVLIVLCFIPSAVAYSSYKQTQNAPVDIKTATKITIDDINGRKFEFEREKEGDEAERLISFFMNMNANATKIVALPDSLMSEKFFKVAISTSIRDELYQYYFSPDPTTNYFIAPDGTSYHIAEADAAQFITTIYAESIYETSSMPVLTLSNTVSLTPDTAIWQYKNYTGSYVDADISDMIFEDVESHTVEGGFSLDFDIQPDYFNVKITDSAGNLMYDDFYDNIGTIPITTTTSVSVDVVARWYEDPSRSFMGELNYNFIARLEAPAEFYLGMDSVKTGRFVAITAVNVTNADRIEMTSDIPNGVTPKFYKDGDYAVALLPIDIDTDAGMYTLTFKYGGTTKSLNLYVEKEAIGSSQISVSDSVLNSTRTAVTVAEFETAAADIMSKSASTRYFSGYFAEGAPSGAQLLRGYGRTILINGSESNTYRNNGVDYSASAGLSVTACNAGEVVYAGSLTYTGNIVVIDHGLGLKTWYYNLGSVDVKVGDKVSRGDTIGTCGSSGFTTMNGVHIAMSVGNRFVCPYDTWSDSSTAGYIKIYGIEP